MANASQFIGSKISLISKSEIRYEGILYSLDVVEATISLAKVKSFGTEDRPTERPVPPKDEIYEFIIFRGSDIKGIDVVEPPQQHAPAVNDGIPNDPAIVEVSHYHSGRGPSGSSFSQQQQTQHSSIPARSGAFGGPKPPVASQQNNSECLNSSLEEPGDLSAPLEPAEGGEALVDETSRSNASTPYGSSSRRSPLVDAGTQVQRNGGGGSRQFSNQNRLDQGRGQGQGGRGRGGGGGGGGGYQDRGGNRPPREPRQAQQQGGQQQQQQQGGQGGYQPRGRGTYNNSRGGNNDYQPAYRGGFRGGRGGYRGRTQGILSAPQTAKVTFDQPYDFEKANEELLTAIKELKIGGDGDGPVPQPAEGGAAEDGAAAGAGAVETDEQENKEPASYYKKDNFFDSISCEALERSKGPVNRVDWKAERKLNAETFGLTGNAGQRRGYYNNYRGGGNGYGGRGYYRGGYGGYGNRGGYQSRGGYGGYSSYNNRYNGGGGGRGGNRGGEGRGSF